MTKICFLFNVAAHYRLPIYRLIDENMDCNIFAGDHMRTKLKVLDYSKLKKFRKVLRNKFFGPFYWQVGAVGLLRNNYKYIVSVGDVYCLSTWVILLLARFYHIKVVSWTHGLYGKEGWFKRHLKVAYYKLHYHVMTYGNFGRQQTIKAGVPEDKVTAIGNSLDSDRNIELRSSLKSTRIYEDHFHNTYPTIIYCGRIQKIKRLDMILNAVKDLNDSGHKVNVIFIGADVDGVNLQDCAKAMGIADNVWFYGPCYKDTTLAEFFYNASVCVSPGNVGLTSIHALSFGCPVITHDDFPNQMPEFEAIRARVTGDFFKEGNQEDLDSKILLWIDKSPEERAKIREVAYKDIDSFWDIHPEYEKIAGILK